MPQRLRPTMKASSADFLNFVPKFGLEIGLANSRALI